MFCVISVTFDLLAYSYFNLLLRSLKLGCGSEMLKEIWHFANFNLLRSLKVLTLAVKYQSELCISLAYSYLCPKIPTNEEIITPLITAFTVVCCR